MKTPCQWPELGKLSQRMLTFAVNLNGVKAYDRTRFGGGGTRGVKASMENQQARSDPPTPHTGGTF